MCVQPFTQAQIKENIKVQVTGLREGNPPVTSGFPLQSTINAENVSIWWCHQELNAWYPSITSHSKNYLFKAMAFWCYPRVKSYTE